jgi:mannitol-1-/sugar-/sorbitol-6-phosphatase
MLTVRAVHFDLDGVLIDSRASIERAWRRWAAQRQIRWESLAPHVAGRLAVDTIRAVLPGIGAARAQAEADTVNAYQVADEADAIAVPGMLELVSMLDGRPWSVVTGAPRALAMARLGRCGYPAPAVLVSAGDVARGKPHPEGYLLASRRLGIGARESLVVEDSAAGIRAGICAGAHVLALSPSPRAAAAPRRALPGVRAGARGAAGCATLTARDGRDVRFRVSGDLIVVEPRGRRRGVGSAAGRPR